MPSGSEKNEKLEIKRLIEKSKTGKKIQRFFFQLRDLFHFIDVPRKKRRRGRGKNIENEDGLKTF